MKEPKNAIENRRIGGIEVFMAKKYDIIDNITVSIISPSIYNKFIYIFQN